MSAEVIPVILAGGEGKRLRPLTSPSRPKPFLKLCGWPSLFQKTLSRFKKILPRPLVILHKAHKRVAEQQLEERGIEAIIISEPAHRSTAPAIALAAFALIDRDCVMLISPSDHYIQDNDVLEKAINEARAHIANGSEFVSIGVSAKIPETRYGYILYDDGHIITKFTEKPDKQTANQYINTGKCAWNTGIFMCRPQGYLKTLKAHRPEMYNTVEAYVNGTGTYESCSSEAVDVAVMENISGAKTVLLETQWRDLGTIPEFFMHFFRTAS